MDTIEIADKLTAGSGYIITRPELTEKIVATKIARDLKWSDLAAKLGMSEVYATAALLGQMTLLPEQAKIAAEIFDLDDFETKLLSVVPSRGSLDSPVPTDPLIYRLYEVVMVYGTTFKELIQEEFGDGIMSAIDFDMEIARVPDPKGDRVKVSMSGKFLPYKRY
jgi:cyanate lyase